MIVRQRGDQYVLMNQHEHGLMAGEMAEHLFQVIRPREETLFAIRNHDIGWIELDRQVVWNEESNQPYSFMDYPLALKLEAYTNGIVTVENENLYAGYLCSKHYAYFIEKLTEPLAKEFLDREQARRQRIRKYFSADEKQYLIDNFRLLRFCDDLSLSICLHDPETGPHDWYQNGIQYNGSTYQWYWEDQTSLRLSPSLFKESFELQIPYRVFNQERQEIESGLYQWQILI
ncbi:Protein of unknown function [Seinonella peptonophila]|uniref:DUF3891 domain-containing protein n=1 Tax=Seinonella peptonophila TaxID=112248 RepID=A0A1M4WMI9_9BACL|nr:DUF3891 family protein [Seinonella peptonophila]SHE82273.1 Protein of unknown function [Seinonella peptonophila]